MTKTEKLIIALVVVLSAVSIVGQIARRNPQALPPGVGSLFVQSNSYSTPPTYTSTTLTNDIATELVARATSSRNIARICMREDNASSTFPVYIWKQGTSTGVATSSGYPIYFNASTSNSQSCFTVDASDPYTGQIWGIAKTTTTLTIEVLQN